MAYSPLSRGEITDVIVCDMREPVNTPCLEPVVHRARTADAHAAPARNAIIATTACRVSERAGAAGGVVTVMAGAWASALAGEACGEAAASARGSALSAFTTSSEDARAPKTAVGWACMSAA